MSDISTQEVEDIKAIFGVNENGYDYYDNALSRFLDNDISEYEFSTVVDGFKLSNGYDYCIFKQKSIDTNECEMHFWDDHHQKDWIPESVEVHSSLVSSIVSYMVNKDSESLNIINEYIQHHKKHYEPFRKIMGNISNIMSGVTDEGVGDFINKISESSAN